MLHSDLRLNNKIGHINVVCPMFCYNVVTVRAMAEDKR